jgi:hypothetical protein
MRRLGVGRALGQGRKLRVLPWGNESGEHPPTAAGQAQPFGSSCAKSTVQGLMWPVIG